LINRDKIADSISSQTVIFHAFFPGNIPQVKVAKMQHISQKEMEPFFNNYAMLFTRIKEWQSKKIAVKLAIKNQAARDNIQRELIDHHLTDIEFINFQVEKGFVSTTMQIALISEKDIWGKRNNPKRQPNRKKEEHFGRGLKI
jgi:transcription-repair coupling factor (superfamily II helicase)